ncbi:hypothetical protein BEN47_16375 [Hymenobacter lapidarius]|uniref:Uncharacterized protein n=1 Tax=Hymenobacter lapidarius TaxID=1908237 RepID=A0A1G1T0R9_9BACT|nr:hypothetical protein [Hymenobacter lapidarius]OGX84468.1 hypothetical protein BEN47_16375 [Hymenobacter lapidarius]
MMTPLWLVLWLLPAEGVAAPVPFRARPVDFSLVVASCFRGDTVSLAVNGLALVTNATATSDFNNGVTGLGVYQNREGLWVRAGGQLTRYPRLDLRQGLHLRFVLGGQVSTHAVKLLKGRVVFFNACHEATQTGAPVRKLTVQQFKKPVALY